MELFITILIFIGKSIYTTIPAIGANVAPILMKKINFLNYPMDFNKTFRGQPILGDHKTFRGLFFGVVYSMVFISIQYFVYKKTNLQLTVYDFDKVNFLFLGFLMGFGVIFGDAVKSFFKRRVNIKPGSSFMPWDQLDCVLGGLLLGRIAWDYPIAYAITTIATTFILHIIIRHIAYYLGLCESRW
ncbi:MAG: hypothetical protein A2086_11885 [Spirochaetes bacterium GWD1_27_9]|nr:MAG: hypothetical protein A2Z98_11495 [Spirochaetes bacterium GWB1_27_13]OHD27462.1 MAG: hypothetical protein A2Y34_16200 [Spirochaetes bacterium GWC1_27_15]OHD28658.1 MAG: hypothetical protein A2086_11885 [Spirochaetes bacterium GWD1_27_9]